MNHILKQFLKLGKIWSGNRQYAWLFLRSFITRLAPSRRCHEEFVFPVLWIWAQKVANFTDFDAA